MEKNLMTHDDCPRWGLRGGSLFEEYKRLVNYLVKILYNFCLPIDNLINGRTHVGTAWEASETSKSLLRWKK